MSAVIFLFLFFLSSGLATLPKGWGTCEQSAPDFQPCMQKAITDAIMSLMPGSKALKTPPMDPLKIPRLAVARHPGAVSLDVTWTDLTISGIKGLQVNRIAHDWKNAEVVCHIPRLNIFGDYEVDGQVLVLPIQGQGKCNITLEEVDVDVKVSGGSIERNGVTYIKMDHFIIDLKPKRMHLHFGNLFNGDKALGDTMNAFLNENWKEIYAEFQPVVQKGLSEAFSAIANQVLSQIPADQIRL